MAEPSQSEMLTAAEALRVNEAMTDESLMSGLRKIFAFESRMQSEAAENEGCSADPNLNKMIQYAARARAAREWEGTIRNRRNVLTVKQRGV